MKKYTVVSTRKNPDRYIEYLKRELEYARRRAKQNWDDLIKERGRHVSNYKDGITSGIFETSLQKARMFKMNDTVMVTGKVYEIKKQGSGYCVYWTEEEIRIRED